MYPRRHATLQCMVWCRCALAQANARCLILHQLHCPARASQASTFQRKNAVFEHAAARNLAARFTQANRRRVWTMAAAHSHMCATMRISFAHAVARTQSVAMQANSGWRPGIICRPFEDAESRTQGLQAPVLQAKAGPTQLGVLQVRGMATFLPARSSYLLHRAYLDRATTRL